MHVKYFLVAEGEEKGPAAIGLARPEWAEDVKKKLRHTHNRHKRVGRQGRLDDTVAQLPETPLRRESWAGEIGRRHHKWFDWITYLPQFS